MTKEQLANEIAKGFINTGVEGGFEAVSCSTAGDYPSIGCSQWEGSRADELLKNIPGGEKYAGRTYSDLESVVYDDDTETPDYDEDGVITDVDKLSALLDSSEGQNAQIQKLAEDTIAYVEELQEIETLDQSRCMIYAAMWCPTNLGVVFRFLQRLEERGYDLRSLEVLRDAFRDEYYVAADVGIECAPGYANRANRTYDYVTDLDLSAYGED